MTERIRINDVSIYDHEDDGGLHWDGNADLKSPGGGTDEGIILVALDVDGMLSCVYGDLGTTGDLTAIERSIEILQRLHAGLTDLYAGHPRDVGYCMDQSDWGRCQRKLGHDGEHRYPPAGLATAS